VLVTGHTGFKGAWLALWLQSLGARVTGLAPGAPTLPSLYELARVGEHMHSELAIDVRDPQAVCEAVRAARPEVLLHMAAQPMVRRSLREPLETFEVNVMGTVNLLEAVRTAGESVRGVVVVTSDKCYANPFAYRPSENESESGRTHRFAEGDPLGGHDPYSSSKACAELVTAAYRDSYFTADDAAVTDDSAAAANATDAAATTAATTVATATTTVSASRVASARAGNVIGGGDFGEDRLVPDILRARAAGEPVRIRNPDAVRPWQHVLNPLSGYLLLAQALCRPDGDGARFARPFNFGPREQDARTVREVVELLDGLLDGGLGHELDEAVHPPEAAQLELDSGEAERALGWRSQWDLEEGLKRVVEWDEIRRHGGDVRAASLAQIADYGYLQDTFTPLPKTIVT
jgi:CDP-glucose 4,6-dehydratase